MGFYDVISTIFQYGILILLHIHVVYSLCDSGYYSNELSSGCIPCESSSYCYNGEKHPCQPNSTSPSKATSIGECICLSDMECTPYHSTSFSMTLNQFEGSRKGIRKYLASTVRINEELIVFQTEDVSNKDQIIKIHVFIPFLHP